MIDLDDARALSAGDPSGMLAAVASLSEHCRDGRAIGLSTIGLPSAEGLTALTFCGMGGSAVAGDLLRALYRERVGIPIDVVRGPVLPEYCGPRTLVICASYSGNTAETLACFREATRRGCRVMVVTSGGELFAAPSASATVVVPGGFQPRAALGFLAFASFGALETAGLLPDLTDDVDETIVELDALLPRLGPAAPRGANLAKDLAFRIDDRVPVIWGSEGIGAVAAGRWKTQFNENAKIPAWASSMPELDHNEVVGWTLPAGRGFFLVALRHEGEHTDIAARFPLSIEIAQQAGVVAEEVWGAGRSALARLMSLVLLGDFTSVYHALAHGVDPTPVAVIDRLKAALAGS